MQIYSKILLQTCITDLLLLIMTLLFQNYTFATKSGEHKTILDGLITINGAENRVWALLAVVCQIWLVAVSVVGYLSQFIFRYLVLNWNKKVSSCNYSIIFLINLLLPLAYCVHLFLCLYPSDGHEFLDDQSVADFIGVNLSEKIILVGYSNNKLNLTIGSCYLIIVCTITYAIMFILALLMHNNLKKLSKTITSKALYTTTCQCVKDEQKVVATGEEHKHAHQITQQSPNAESKGLPHNLKEVKDEQNEETEILHNKSDQTHSPKKQIGLKRKELDESNLASSSKGLKITDPINIDDDDSDTEITKTNDQTIASTSKNEVGGPSEVVELSSDSEEGSLSECQDSDEFLSDYDEDSDEFLYSDYDDDDDVMETDTSIDTDLIAMSVIKDLEEGADSDSCGPSTTTQHNFGESSSGTKALLECDEPTKIRAMVEQCKTDQNQIKKLINELRLSANVPPVASSSILLNDDQQQLNKQIIAIGNAIGTIYYGVKLAILPIDAQCNLMADDLNVTLAKADMILSSLVDLTEPIEKTLTKYLKKTKTRLLLALEADNDLINAQTINLKEFIGNYSSPTSDSKKVVDNKLHNLDFYIHLFTEMQKLLKNFEGSSLLNTSQNLRGLWSRRFYAEAIVDKATYPPDYIDEIPIAPEFDDDERHKFEDEYTINRRAGVAMKLFDGDIVLRSNELVQMRNKNSQADANTVQYTNWITNDTLRWPVDTKARNENGNLIGPVINFTLDWNKIVIPASVKWMNNILDAHKNIEKHTCVRFRNSTEGDHLHYYWGYGCNSQVGRSGGKQWISLGPGCWMVNGVHETLHALGTNHEQSRLDRDAFIKIHQENMIENIADAFAIIPGSPTGNPYDYGSVMHYNAKAFAKNDKSTIETIDKNYQQTMGWRLGLSFLDAKAINHRYCEHVCDDYPWHAPDCRNGGYANPNNCTQCLCPLGYAPPYCDHVELGHVEGNPMCPGESDILLTEQNPTLTEMRWYNATNFTCYWRLRAPADHYIEVKLFKLDGFKCDQSCYNFIEVKHGNLANSGPRFCCEMPTESMFTDVPGHEVIIFASAVQKGNYSVGLTYSITK
uniref:Metalloendopeptidase n=1 Tax=Globodera rostochiensis TaxID=31243 RepID=A0A914IEZ8_GLORO